MVATPKNLARLVIPTHGELVWTSRTFPVSGGFTKMTYGLGPGLFVGAVSGSSTLYTSPDGITWTSRSTSATSTSWSDLIYANGLYLIVASNSSNTSLMTSSDGITWTSRTLPSTAAWSGLAYGNGVYVCTNQTSATVAYSFDGITWTAVSLPSSGVVISPVYGNGGFIAPYYSSTTCYVSADGLNWTSNANMPAANAWGISRFGNGIVVAVNIAGSASAMARSTNYGLTWEATSFQGNTGSISGIDYGAGCFMMFNSTDNKYWTSVDGLIWIKRTITGAGGASTACYGNGTWVVSPASGTTGYTSSTNTIYTAPAGGAIITDMHIEGLSRLSIANTGTYISVGGVQVRVGAFDNQTTSYYTDIAYSHSGGKHVMASGETIAVGTDEPSVTATFNGVEL